ncbi:hypothetical protein [Vibrio porteresiae]|uniref:Phage protein n=1 Tax=Vibrio porteresiae DSM 19223 TaxID=1123496 RepID=A0ABZ0QM62_9VIBR|nr:hypothetical protein [Vibrio porteresiae]WPC76777.1 hypothetical protein R8Z52_19820 [Vibrio porteresiae DSM 19223]
MKVNELIENVVNKVAWHNRYGGSFFDTYYCCTEYVQNEKPYGPFSLKEVNTMLWEFFDMLDDLKASKNGVFQTLNLYGFRVNGFYFELDKGFYTHPSVEISSATSTEPYDLYKVVEMFGSEDDKEKFNDSGVLDDIGWDYYLPLGDS